MPEILPRWLDVDMIRQAIIRAITYRVTNSRTSNIHRKEKPTPCPVKVSTCVPDTQHLIVSLLYDFSCCNVNYWSSERPGSDSCKHLMYNLKLNTEILGNKTSIKRVKDSQLRHVCKDSVTLRLQCKFSGCTRFLVVTQDLHRPIGEPSLASHCHKYTNLFTDIGPYKSPTHPSSVPAVFLLLMLGISIILSFIVIDVEGYPARNLR